jgi:hypothetical protein
MLPRIPRLIVLSGVLLSACSNPMAPDEPQYGLAGVVRDSSSQPIADARIEIASGAFAGRFTTSNAAGEFHFVDPLFVSELITLRISKEGYRPAFAPVGQLRIVVTLVPNATQGTITFKAAATCNTLPASLMSRTYTATIDIWEPASIELFIALTGADFFTGLSTMWGNIGRAGSVAVFNVNSYEAYRNWLEELPIYERIGATGYVSLLGVATTGVPPREDSFTTRFEGTISYCPNATDRGNGFPPECRVAEIQCRSDRHELRGTRH